MQPNPNIPINGDNSSQHSWRPYLHVLSGNPHKGPIIEGLSSSLSHSWGNKASESIDSLLKATQLSKEQSQVSVPSLLHLKELLIFRQIIPTGLVLEISYLNNSGCARKGLARRDGATELSQLPSTCSLEPPGHPMLLCVLLGGLAAAPMTTVIRSGLPQFNSWLTPKETSALEFILLGSRPHHCFGNGRWCLGTA